MKKKAVIIVAAVLVVAAAFCAGIFLGKDKNTVKPPKDGELSIKATFDELTVGDNILDNVAEHNDRWSQSLLVNYGMDEKTRDKLLEAPEEWLAFNYIIDIDNLSAEDVLVSGLEVKDNGKNGVYISKNLDGLSVFNAGGSSFICVTVFHDGNEPSLEEVEKIVKGMKMNVIYSAVPADLDAEIPEDQIYRAQVVMG